MVISPAGIALVKRFEGLRLVVYDDATGKPLAPDERPRGTATVGYGHALRPGESWPGNRISLAQADALLAADLRWAEAAVGAVPCVLTQVAFDALVDFAYNVGAGAFRASSVYAHLTQDDVVAAADALLYYDRLPDGSQSPGLLDRRRAERAMMLSDIPITRIDGQVAPVLADDLDEPDPPSEPQTA